MGKDRSADGLRGVAAASVVAHHLLLAFFPLALAGLFPWVANPGAAEGAVVSLASNPALTALWNGQLPVCVFFVLSGYVLTRRFFTQNDAEHIRSQAARRYIRLGMPVFFSVLLAYALVVSGAFGAAEAATITRSEWLRRSSDIHAHLWAALVDGSYGALLLGHKAFNRVLWTMRVELIGSMLIFAYCLLAGRRHLIFSVLYAALVISASRDFWPFYLAFLIGAHIGRIGRPFGKPALYAMALTGYVVASIPPDAGLWSVLPFHVPRMAVASVIGGALIVYAVRLGAFAGLLQSRIAQWLGRVSYSLYLIHLPLLFSAGCWAFVLAFRHGAGYMASATLGLLATAAVALPLSALFERFIDANAIVLARWAVGQRMGMPLHRGSPSPDRQQAADGLN